MVSMTTAWTDRKAIPPACIPAPMQQSAAYHRTCAALGHTTVCLTLGDVSAPSGQAHILLRRWPVIGPTAYLAQGPVWASDLSSTHKTQAFHDLHRLLHRRYRTVITTGSPCPPDAIPILTGATSALWDLGPDLRARLHQKWRNRLMHAEMAGLSLRRETLPNRPDHWLLKVNKTQAHQRGYRSHPPAFLNAWAHANGPNAGFILSAHHRGQRIAAILILIHGTTATYQIGWSDPTGRQTSAHNFLLWHAARTLQATGITQLDLGLLDTHRAPGLARFKLGTGARAHHYGPTTLTAPFTRLFAKQKRGGHIAAPAPLSW